LESPPKAFSPMSIKSSWALLLPITAAS
jgi:hypothetical protein